MTGYRPPWPVPEGVHGVERLALYGLWAAAAVAVAVCLWMLLSAREDPPPAHPFTWPTIVRTVDGVPTTVQPEDLGR